MNQDRPMPRTLYTTHPWATDAWQKRWRHSLWNACDTAMHPSDQLIAAEPLDPAGSRSSPATGFPWIPLVVLSLAGMMLIGVILEIALRVGDLRASNAAELRCAGALTQLQGQKGLFRLDSESGFAMRPVRSARQEHCAKMSAGCSRTW